MPMITFVSLIVVPQHALTGNDVGQPIFEVVRRGRHGAWQPPYHNFDERIRGWGLGKRGRGLGGKEENSIEQGFLE